MESAYVLLAEYLPRINAAVKSKVLISHFIDEAVQNGNLKLSVGRVGEPLFNCLESSLKRLAISLAFIFVSSSFTFSVFIHHAVVTGI